MQIQRCNLQCSKSNNYGVKSNQNSRQIAPASTPSFKDGEAFIPVLRNFLAAVEAGQPTWALCVEALGAFGSAIYYIAHRYGFRHLGAAAVSRCEDLATHMKKNPPKR